MAKRKKRAAKKTKRRVSAAKAAPSPRGSSGWAFIGTLPIIGFILVLLAKKNDKYAMFYGKQGLTLGIAYLIINFALTLLVITIPLTLIWSIIVFVLWLMSAANSFSGKMKYTPWVGRWAERFRL